MKKLIVTLVAAFMVLSVAAVASAKPFGTAQLGLAIYEDKGSEVIFDIGKVSGIDFTQKNVEILGANAWTGSDVGGADLAELGIGMYAFNPAGDDTFWIATTDYTGVDINTASFNNFKSAVGNLNRYLDNSGETKVNIDYATDTFSFDKVMNQNSNSPGFYANLNRDFAVGEGKFNAQGYADMYLYGYTQIDGTLVDGVAVDNGVADYVAAFRVYGDGSVIMNHDDALLPSSAVPVPGAIVLLGSGLLALVGIRRKN